MDDWLTLDTLPSDIIFGASGVQEVMQNVKLLLMTRKGTQPIDREFGISYDFLDSPVSRTKAMVEQELFIALKKYEPRAVLKQISWNDDPIRGKIGPKVSIQVV